MLVTSSRCAEKAAGRTGANSADCAIDARRCSALPVPYGHRMAPGRANGCQLACSVLRLTAELKTLDAGTKPQERRRTCVPRPPETSGATTKNATVSAVALKGVTARPIIRCRRSVSLHRGAGTRRDGHWHCSRAHGPDDARCRPALPDHACACDTPHNRSGRGRRPLRRP